METSGGSRVWLDPAARPSTALGELRARYLPVWASDFDWAFPPEVCGTAWELDAVAAGDAQADVAAAGEFAAAAAIAVMRYEYLTSRAFAAPSLMGQLCVAVGSVGEARSDALGVLGGLLGTGTSMDGPAAFPQEVTLVAAGPAGVLVVACTVKDPAAGSEGSAVLGAYTLAVSRGLEDPVVDISYRVSDAAKQNASDCGMLSEWTATWDGIARGWDSEGQIWQPVGDVVDVGTVCASAVADAQCPTRWLL